MNKFNAGKASVLVLTAVFAFVVGSMLLAGLGVFTQPVAATPATIEEVSAQLNFNGAGGWGGWSCPEGHPFIVSASVTTPDDDAPLYPITSLTLWKAGATVSGFTYSATPWGYTYGVGEEGAIVQNNFTTAQSLKIHLICGLQAPDVCENLDGDQATLPDGMQVDNEDFCSCKLGYHEVDSEGQTVTADGLNNFTCVADSTPTPTATPSSNNNGFTNDGGDGLGCATHDCSGNANKVSQGQVLGASTMAGTGVAEDNLFNMIFIVGVTLTTLGIRKVSRLTVK